MERRYKSQCEQRGAGEGNGRASQVNDLARCLVWASLALQAFHCFHSKLLSGNSGVFALVNESSTFTSWRIQVLPYSPFCSSVSIRICIHSAPKWHCWNKWLLIHVNSISIEAQWLTAFDTFSHCALWWRYQCVSPTNPIGTPFRYVCCSSFDRTILIIRARSRSW